MALDVNSIIKKAKQEAKEKAEKTKIKEQLAAVKAEEERRKETERREKERLEREEKDRIRREQEAEAKRKKEEEEERVREEQRKQAEEERNNTTLQCSAEMEAMNLTLSQYVTKKNVSYAQMNKLLSEAKKLLSRDVDFWKISCYATFKNNVNTLENLAENKKEKEKKTKALKGFLLKAIVSLVVIAGLIFGCIVLYQHYMLLKVASVVGGIAVLAGIIYIFAAPSYKVDDKLKIVTLWLLSIIIAVGLGIFLYFLLKQFDPEKVKNAGNIAFAIIGAIIGLCGGVIGCIGGLFAGAIIGYFLGWVITTIAGLFIIIAILVGIACFIASLIKGACGWYW